MKLATLLGTSHIPIRGIFLEFVSWKITKVASSARKGEFSQA